MPVIANKRKMARYRSRPKAKLMNMAPEKMSAWKERRGELGVREASGLQGLAEARGLQAREATLERVAEAVS